MQTHPGGFTAEENARYNCGAFAGTFIDSRYQVPSYDLVNASLRFTPDEGPWMASLYINNLTDEVPYLSSSAYPVSGMGRSFFLGATARF